MKQTGEVLAPMSPEVYAYDEGAKRSHSADVRKFYRMALKQLPSWYSAKIHYNRGGIAVWGETYLRILPVLGRPSGVEAYDTRMGMLVRQWDGRNSGRNHYVRTLAEFVALVQKLESEPFQRV